MSLVKSIVNLVDPVEWDFVCLLPTEKFQKKSKDYVWDQSWKIINKK